MVSTTATGAVEINAKYLTTDAELQAFITRAQQAPWLAMDTEFVRERTYAPRLCLIQFATPDEIVLLDVLAVQHPQALAPLLTSGPLKLLHSPGQDFEALDTIGLPQIAPIFDTQVAHALLGGPAQIGYAGLLKEKLGVDLPKDQTRTDWSRRPLSPGQLEYAADDVRYLGEMYGMLQSALQAQGRDGWMDEEMTELAQPWSLPSPISLATKSRVLERLEGDEKCVFVALSLWREERARRSDKPRSWIAKDGFLNALARRQPRTLQALADIDGATPGLVRSQGKIVLQTIAEAVENCPELPREIPREQCKVVQKAVAVVAEDLGLDAAVLASRVDCEEWLRNQGGKLARGWRKVATAKALSEE